MKTVEFLNKMIDCLPVNQCECLTFKENVFKSQKEFLKEFSLVDENDLKLFLPLIPSSDKQITKRILTNKFYQIFSKLNSTIEKYYEGKPASAYQEIKGLLIHSKYSRHLSDAYFGFLDIKDFRAFNELHWYRLRQLFDEEKENPKASHLFHPPYEKRGKIGNFRFSISGFPCLYMGDSLNICWEETNKKKENIFASRLTFTGNQSFLRPLNITIPEPFTDEIYNKDSQLNSEAFCFLLTFPLIQLCLYKVKHEDINDNFKPEYIIPQLLMQFISEEGFFNSVIYSSTKLKNDKHNHNLVLPVRKVMNWGFCPELKKKVKATAPLPVLSFDLENLKKIECELLKTNANTLASL